MFVEVIKCMGINVIFVWLSLLPFHAEPVNAVETFESLSVETEQNAPVQIFNFILPKYEIATLKNEQNAADYQAFAVLENLHNSLLNQEPLPRLDEIRHGVELSASYGLDPEIASHLYALIDELEKPSYSLQARRDYLKWDLTLTLTFLKGESSSLQNKVEELHHKIMVGNYHVILRSSYGHSPSYFLIDDETQAPFAILKESSPEIFSSFQRLLPSMPLNAPVWEHELAGFEQDQLFGFDHTPTTLAVRFQNHLGNTVNGSVQEFIPEAKAGVDFYNLEGADLLLGISKAHVHAVALSGFFKGLSAGHMTNYILQLQNHEDGSKTVKSIFEIDLEEMLLPYNKLSDDFEALPQTDPAVPERELAAKSIILCRMWILGLPQNAEAFDRAALLVMSNPVLLPLLKSYHEEAAQFYHLDQGSWNAQYARTLEIQTISLEELKKAEVTLTPRDLYFKLFGGEHLWKIAQAKHYPSMVAFNHLISDPYQHVLKDFAHPESIPESTLLEKPRSDTQESLELMLFLRKMQ